jgi:hypothetical protein
MAHAYPKSRFTGIDVRPARAAARAESEGAIRDAAELGTAAYDP